MIAIMEKSDISVTDAQGQDFSKQPVSRPDICAVNCRIRLCFPTRESLLLLDIVSLCSVHSFVFFPGKLKLFFFVWNAIGTVVPGRPNATYLGQKKDWIRPGVFTEARSVRKNPMPGFSCSCLQSTSSVLLKRGQMDVLSKQFGF